MRIETFRYDNRVVRAFAIATVIWAVVGMSAGLLAAVQLFLPNANLSLPYTTFGRLRPLHTHAPGLPRPTPQLYRAGGQEPDWRPRGPGGATQPRLAWCWGCSGW